MIVSDMLSKAEVGEFDVTLVIDEEVLWLEITVNDAAIVQVL